MRYSIHIEGFEGQTIDVISPGVFSGAKLLLNGHPAQKDSKSGEMILKRTDGREVRASWKARHGGLDFPQLEVDGTLISIVRPLKWYEMVWSGIPIFLFFLGDVVGVILGIVCFDINVRIFRSHHNTFLRFLVTGSLSVLAAIITLATGIWVTASYWHYQDLLPAVSWSTLWCAGWSVSALMIAGVAASFLTRAAAGKASLRIVPISMFVVLTVCCVMTWVWMRSVESPSPFWKPSNQEMAGTYSLDQYSMKKLEELGYTQVRAPTLVTLKEDETFTATDLPDVFWLYGGAKHMQQSGSGTWKFSKNADGRWLLTIHLTELGGAEVDQHSILYLSGRQAPYTVYFSLGELSALVFEKRRD